MMTNCFWCNSPMIWNSDFSFEDYGIEGEGSVATLSCSNEECGASAEFMTKMEDN